MHRHLCMETVQDTLLLESEVPKAVKNPQSLVSPSRDEASTIEESHRSSPYALMVSVSVRRLLLHTSIFVSFMYKESLSMLSYNVVHIFFM